MKAIRHLFIALFLISYLMATGQKTRTLYYNDQWKLTIQDSSQYRRICQLDTIKNLFIGRVQDFSGDTLLMDGIYKKGKKEGGFTFYYPSGQIESEGAFSDNIRTGVWKYYYPDGKLLREVRFDKESFILVSAYSEKGDQLAKDGTGEWNYTYEWPGLSQRLIVRGSFLNGKMEDEWTCSYENGQVIYKEIFKDGKFQKGFYTNPDGSFKEAYTEEIKNKFLLHFKHSFTEEFTRKNGITIREYPFINYLPVPYFPRIVRPAREEYNGHAEKGPEFPGGQEGLNQYVFKKIKYPASARASGIGGVVYIDFIIDADGRILDPYIVSGINYDFDKHILLLILEMPKWKPATLHGKPIRTFFQYPVAFKID